jgi:hypothetical protein
MVFIVLSPLKIESTSTIMSEIKAINIDALTKAILILNRILFCLLSFSKKIMSRIKKLISRISKYISKLIANKSNKI